MKNLVNYLPEFLQGIEEIKTICEVEEPEILLIEENIKKILRDCFIDSADEDGVKRMEQIMGIIPMGTDTMADRKFRLKGTVIGYLPYTLKNLSKKLQEAANGNPVEIEMHYDQYTMVIKVPLEAKRQYDILHSIIKKMIPANLLLEYGLKYNSHKILSAFTHLELKSYTHQELRENVLEQND